MRVDTTSEYTNLAYPAIDEYEELTGMIVKWLEEYQQLEPLINEMQRRLADGE
jgi:hypothetical protein